MFRPSRFNDSKLPAGRPLCGLILLLLPLLAQAQAPAQPLPRAGDSVEVYIVRTGDTLIGITTHYLGKPDLWPENLRLNPGIKDPRHLQPGSRIRIIVARKLPARNALMNRVARKVEAKPNPQPWTSARPGDLLKESDGVRTYEKSSAELLFDDGSHLVMTENSLLFLKRMERDRRGPGRETVEIIDGQVDVKSSPQSKVSAEVELIIGSASIKQSSTPQKPMNARSRRAADSKAQVMVYGGTANVASAGKTVKVPNGMGTQVEEGKPPATPQKLLIAPSLVSPDADAIMRGDGFSWKAVPGAVGYTLEVFRDATATQIVDRVTGLRQTSWRPAQELPLEDMYWRVTAVSATGLDGFPAAPRRVRAAGGVKGTVFEDLASSGSQDQASPLAGARVLAYRDNGNGKPDDGDARAGESRTDSAGHFSFDLAPGTYWIAADSLSIVPSAGLNPGARREDTWAEQTFGPAGALCDVQTGEPRLREEPGPCVGGRWATRSDDPSRLSTSKHVARTVMSTEAPPPLSFGFSFGAVDHAGDAAEAGSSRSSQGSLRQFIRNANAIFGSNGMRFLPMVPPTDRTDRAWWTVRATAPLPPLTDAETHLYGSAWDATEPVRRAPGASESDETPDLEIVLAGDGLAVNAQSRISAIAITAAGTALRVAATTTVFGVYVGAHPDGKPSSPPVTGIEIESGETQLTRVTVAGSRKRAVHVGPLATFSANRLTVRSAGAGGEESVLIESPRAMITDSDIEGVAGARGIVLAPETSSVRITSSTVSHCLDGIVVRGASTDNRFFRTRFVDIANNAVLFEPVGSAVPVRNRVSQCEFESVMTPIGMTAGQPAKAGECAYDEPSPNRGIAPPEIKSFETVPRKLLALYGHACIGASVEIYEGTVEERTSAKYLQTSAAAYDGTFTLLISKFDETTRMLVSLIDKDGNTSVFVVSPPPKLDKNDKKKTSG